MDAAAFCPETGGNDPSRSVAFQEGLSPTLRAGNTPAIVCKCFDAIGNGDGSITPTITGDHESRVTDYTSVILEPIPIHDQATRFSGKRGDKSDGKGNGLGVGNTGDPMNTLTSGDRHAIAYPESITIHGETISGTLLARDYKGCGRWDSLNKVIAHPVVFDKEVYNS
jgi:hypothetical protein